MLNDDFGILLGLYRECTGCVVLEEKPNSTIKQLLFFDEIYEITERRFKNKFTWKMYKGERELSRDEIIMVFAASNLKRHLLSIHF
jgi:hypothetical protein